MKMRQLLWALAGTAILAGVGFAIFGDTSPLLEKVKSKIEKKDPEAKAVPPPAVTVARVKKHDFIETVLVTGSFVARDEIVVAPEVEGLRIIELRADEGDRVQPGDVLAVLENKQLSYQLEQRDAALKRAIAAIEQAKSQITEAKARRAEASKSLKRAKPLRRNKYISQSVIDQRQAAAVSASAQVVSAEEGLRVAEANKAEIEAQQRELAWRVSRAEIKAPAAGLISKRNARIGEIAIGANAFSGDAPMFRLIAQNEVELDAEVPETAIAKIKKGQVAYVSTVGFRDVKGTVRLVSPEIDRKTRLGRVRIFFGDDERLKIGSFGRGKIETRRSNGLSVPLSSVIYTSEGPTVLVIENGKAKSRLIKTGLVAKGVQEVLAGLIDGDLVVAKAGTFLRDGDAVKAILPEPKVSEAVR